MRNRAHDFPILHDWLPLMPCTIPPRNFKEFLVRDFYDEPFVDLICMLCRLL